ncbi:MAG: sigma-54 interaction domain-containing protein [Ignavibacteriales bacterium]
MLPLESAQPDIQMFITVLSKALALEMAVFNSRGRLVASTAAYLQHKGHDTHAPFVEGVLAHGNVLAFEPGHMDLCTGCRFQDRCPATAEILQSIWGEGGRPLGVLSLSSFTEEGRTRLTEHRDTFLDLLKEASNLIATMVAHELREQPECPRGRRPEWGSHVSFDDIKGNSRAMCALKETARHVARSPSTLLLYGETGTGKELLARAIHHESPRKDGPFVAVNCAGIPESLLESELFGYEEGAFTGARKGGKPGRLDLAQRGTLFLDEIGDMPLHLQSKLLRVLQERAIERVGGIGLIPIDIRLIAATNKDIEDLAAQGLFRRDLYYRINVIPLRIPPLRDRLEDIETLAVFFLDKYQAVARGRVNGFTRDAMECLQGYNWPGNVRELENAVEYAMNMETGPFIQRGNLPPRLQSAPSCADSQVSLEALVKDYERRVISQALDRHGWGLNGKAAAARELGIGMRTLYRKLAGKK